jgi:hypothetical protein
MYPRSLFSPQHLHCRCHPQPRLRWALDSYTVKPRITASRTMASLLAAVRASALAMRCITQTIRLSLRCLRLVIGSGPAAQGSNSVGRQDAQS